MSAVLAITGLPGSGKTTLGCALAAALNLQELHTDAYKDAPWDEQPERALATLQRIGFDPRGNGWLVEGITVARMFRYGFRPDCVLHLLGGREHPGLPALLQRGLVDFRNTNGRIVTLPQYPSVRAALLALGNPQRKAPHDPDRVQPRSQGDAR